MSRDALVVGSGPNGLAAAIVLARGGYSVQVHEAAAQAGGACSSAPLTLPGFLHDVGSAVHPLALASPFFSSLPLAIDWLQPVPLAHPLDDGTAILLHRDLSRTAQELAPDSEAWQSLFGPLVRNWDVYRHEVLAPLGVTTHPILMAKLGLASLPSAHFVILHRFQGIRAQALFAGLAAHYPFLEQPLSAGFGLVLGAAAHAGGWPIPRGGAQAITDSLLAVLRSLGGVVHNNSPVLRLDGSEGLVLADTSPRALAQMSRTLLPAGFRRSLEQFRYGPGCFKIDWALRAPIPWRAAACYEAGTVHLGGTAQEILASEAAATAGRHCAKPFVLLSQPTLFDPSRAPAGKHTAWAYCHVPNGSPVDMTAAIEQQVERFAPGFRDTILARHTANAPALESYNPNLVGGDVTGGVSDLRQTLFRPTRFRCATPNPSLWLCSASTAPGAGVHGMCGFHAATAALRAHR